MNKFRFNRRKIASVCLFLVTALGQGWSTWKNDSNSIYVKNARLFYLFIYFFRLILDNLILIIIRK